MKRLFKLFIVLTFSLLLASCSLFGVNKPKPQGEEIDYSSEVLAQTLSELSENLETFDNVLKARVEFDGAIDGQKINLKLTSHFSFKTKELWLDLDLKAKVEDEDIALKLNAYLSEDKLYLDISTKGEELKILRNGKFVMDIDQDEIFGDNILDFDVNDILSDLIGFNLPELDLEELSETLKNSNAIKLYKDDRYFTIEAILKASDLEELEIDDAEGLEQIVLMLILKDNKINKAYFSMKAAVDDELMNIEIDTSILVEEVKRAPVPPKPTQYEEIDDISKLIDLNYIFDF